MADRKTNMSCWIPSIYALVPVQADVPPTRGPLWVKGGSRAYSRVRPNFSDKQTFERRSCASEKCHFQTHAV